MSPVHATSHSLVPGLLGGPTRGQTVAASCLGCLWLCALLGPVTLARGSPVHFRLSPAQKLRASLCFQLPVETLNLLPPVFLFQ